MLPQKLYEFLRWMIIIVSPATCTLLLTLEIPNAETIVLYITAFTTFFGSIFGISKVVNDKKK